MNGCRYYSFYGDEKGLSTGSRKSAERELVLNCAGCFCSKRPFLSDNKNGRQDYYLMYIASGKLNIFSCDKVLEASSGSVVLFRANEGYKYQFSGGETLEYCWAHFTGSRVEKILEEYSLDTFKTPIKVPLNNHIQARFQSIFDAYLKLDAFRDRELSVRLEHLLITVARLIASKSPVQTSISKSIKYIAEYHNLDIKIPQLAKMENLSVSRYNYLFKAHMGISPTQYIMQQRMLSARDLVCSTNLPIKEIGMMCGYPDSHFFCKVFKKMVGVSPSEYRNGSAK